MAQIIEVPGHGEIEFPDDMSDEQIKNVIHTKLLNTSSGSSPSPQAPPNPQSEPQQKPIQAGSGFMRLAPYLAPYLASPHVVNTLGAAGKEIYNTAAGLRNWLPGKKMEYQPIGNTVDDYVGSAIGFGLPALLTDGLTAAALKGASKAPAIGRAASALTTDKFLPTAGRAALSSGAFGAATNPEHPVDSAINYGLTAPALYAGGATAAGIGGLLFKGAKSLGRNLANYVPSGRLKQNIVLNEAKNAAREGLANTPSEALQNLNNNYLDSHGNPLPVDLGTLIGYGPLKNEYESGANIPFVGKNVVRNQRALKRGIYDRDIANQENLVNETASEIASHQENLKNLNLLKQLSENGGETQQANSLSNAIQSNQNLLNNHNELISNAPSTLQALRGDLKPNVSENEVLKKATQRVRKDVDKEAEANYKPLHEADVDFSKLNLVDALPNYNRSSRALLENQGTLKDLFGDAGDLGTAVNKEIERAKNVFKIEPKDNNPDYFDNFFKNESGAKYKNPVAAESNKLNEKLPELMARYQNIKRASSHLAKNGHNNEARVLGNLGDALENDLHKALEVSGRSDLSDQLKMANQHYLQEKVPFYKNNNLNKFSRSGSNFTPVGREISKPLLDPNAESIFRRLTPEERKLAIYQDLTQGKSNAQGQHMLDAQDMVKNYENLDANSKRMINKYHPDIDGYLTSLNHAVSNKDILKENIKSLNRQLGDARYESDSIKKSRDDKIKEITRNLNKALKTHGKRLDTLNKMRNDKLNIVSDINTNLPDLFSGNIREGILSKILGGGKLLTNSSLVDELYNPQTIQRYLASDINARPRAMNRLKKYGNITKRALDKGVISQEEKR